MHLRPSHEIIFGRNLKNKNKNKNWREPAETKSDRMIAEKSLNSLRT